MGTTDELRSETSFNFCNCFIFVNRRKKTEAWKLDVEAIRWRWLDSFMWCRSLRYAHVNSTDSRWHFLSGDGLLETRMYSISPKLGFGNMALHKYTHAHWRNAFFSFISRCDLGDKKMLVLHSQVSPSYWLEDIFTLCLHKGWTMRIRTKVNHSSK